MSSSDGTVLFKSPRDHGIYVKVQLPPNFDTTQFHKVNELAKQVYDIANGTGNVSFRDFPVDQTALVAVMIAQQCCRDEDEWKRVTELGRAIVFLLYGEVVQGRKILLTEESMRFIREKKST
jgi:hypothetical protein